MLDPFEGEPLVKQAHVQIPVLADRLTRQKTKRSDAVIKVDKDDAVIGLTHNFATIKVCILIPSETAPLNEEPHGQIRGGSCIGRSPDIDEQTVFLNVGDLIRVSISNTYCAELNRVLIKAALNHIVVVPSGLSHLSRILHLASIRRRILGRAPAEITKWRRSKAHSKIFIYARNQSIPLVCCITEIDHCSISRVHGRTADVK